MAMPPPYKSHEISGFDIYVGSLPLSADKSTISGLFDKFGKIIFVKFLEKDKHGKKAAFVHFVNEADALQAIKEMNMFMYQGVCLPVKKSDRWLKRENGDDKSNGNQQYSKGVFKDYRQPIKIQGRQGGTYSNSNNNSSNIGMWQPPAADSRKSSSSHGSVSSTENESTTILKQSVMVTHIEDSMTFYASFAGKFESMRMLETQLQTICPNLQPILNKPSDKTTYGALYSLDNHWYRCKVLELVQSEMAVIQYIDYGNLEKVKYTTLVELPGDMQLTQPMAMKCVLRNVKPVPNNERAHEEVTDYLKANIMEQILSATLQPVGNGSYLEVIGLCNQKNQNVLEPLINKGLLLKNFLSNANTRSASSCNGKNSSSHSNQSAFPSNKRGKAAPTDLVATPPILANQEKMMMQSEMQRLTRHNAKALGRIEALQDEVECLLRNQVQPTPFSQWEVIVTNIEKVRLLRQQLPVRSKSSDYVDIAMQLLKTGEKNLAPFDKEMRQKVEKNVDVYNNMQKQISMCEEKDKLVELVTRRNELRKNLHEELTSFYDTFHSCSVQKRIDSFEATLAELRKIYQPFLEMKTYSQTEMPLQELYRYYNTSKEEKAAEFLEIQMKTDQAHKAFIEELQPSITPLDMKNDKEVSVPKLTEVFSDLKNCLDHELKACNLEDSSETSIISVITQLLCHKLETELKGIRDLGCLEQKYATLLQNLALGLAGDPPDMQDLVAKKKEIRNLRSKLRHAIADKKDLEEDEASESETQDVNKRLADVRFNLHERFLEQDHLISKAACLQEASFPELKNQYPELGLEHYNKYKGLVKTGLELDHFDLESIPTLIPSEIDYASRFLHKPIRLKEIHVGEEKDKEMFLELLQAYAAISHNNLLQVDAAFFIEKSRYAYVQQALLPTLRHHVEDNDALMSLRDICRILREILSALVTLHNNNMVHGRLHPATVFLTPELGAVLDSVSFIPNKSPVVLPPVNGINFQLPSRLEKPKTPKDDVYAFICLALWLINPDTDFVQTNVGLPDISELRMENTTAQILLLVRDVLAKPFYEYPQAIELMCHLSVDQQDESQEVEIYESVDGDTNGSDVTPSLMPTQGYGSDTEDETVPELESCRLVPGSDWELEGVASTSQSEIVNSVDENMCEPGSEASEDELDSHLAFEAMRQSFCVLRAKENSQPV